MKSFSGYVWVLWLCIALLAIGNSAAALRIVALRRMASAGPPQLSPTGVETFLDMVSRGTAAPISWSPAGRYAVIFVFTPFDCPAALDELETLAELSRERHDIGVYRIMSGASEAEVRLTSRSFHSDFPIVADTSARLGHILEPPQTPWKLVVDYRAGTVVAEEGPSLTDSQRRAFLERLTRLEVFR